MMMLCVTVLFGTVFGSGLREERTLNIHPDLRRLTFPYTSTPAIPEVSTPGDAGVTPGGEVCNVWIQDMSCKANTGGTQSLSSQAECAAFCVEKNSVCCTWRTYGSHTLCTFNTLANINNEVLYVTSGQTFQSGPDSRISLVTCPGQTTPAGEPCGSWVNDVGCKATNGGTSELSTKQECEEYCKENGAQCCSWRTYGYHTYCYIDTEVDVNEENTFGAAGNTYHNGPDLWSTFLSCPVQTTEFGEPCGIWVTDVGCKATNGGSSQLNSKDECEAYCQAHGAQCCSWRTYGSHSYCYVDTDIDGSEENTFNTEGNTFQNGPDTWTTFLSCPGNAEM